MSRSAGANASGSPSVRSTTVMKENDNSGNAQYAVGWTSASSPACLTSPTTPMTSLGVFSRFM